MKKHYGLIGLLTGAAMLVTMRDVVQPTAAHARKPGQSQKMESPRPTILAKIRNTVFSFDPLSTEALPPKPAHTKNHPLAAKIDLKAIAAATPGTHYDSDSSIVTNEPIEHTVDDATNTALVYRTREEGVWVMGSPVDDQTRAYAFRNLPRRLHAALKAVLNGQLDAMSPLGAKAYEEQGKIQRAVRQRQEAQFQVVAALPKPEDSFRIAPDEALVVAQHEMRVTKADSAHPILGTFGAGPCLAVAVFNPATHVLAMAHVDALTPDKEVLRLIDAVRGAEDSLLEVHMAGGNRGSHEQVLRLIETIQAQPNVAIKTADIGLKNVDRPLASRALAVDARTGQVTGRVEPPQLDCSDLKNRMQIVGLLCMPTPLFHSADPIEGPAVDDSVPHDRPSPPWKGEESASKKPQGTAMPVP